MPVMLKLKTLEFKPLNCESCQFNEPHAIIDRGRIKGITYRCSLGASKYKNCPISNTPAFLKRQFGKVAK